MKSGTEHPTSREELREKLAKLSSLEVLVELCGNCKHDWYSHYWNGAGMAANSGWDSCKVSGCNCQWEDAHQEKQFGADQEAISQILDAIDQYVAEKELQAQINCLQNVLATQTRHIDYAETDSYATRYESYNEAMKQVREGIETSIVNLKAELANMRTRAGLSNIGGEKDE